MMAQNLSLPSTTFCKLCLDRTFGTLSGSQMKVESGKCVSDLWSDNGLTGAQSDKVEIRSKLLPSLSLKHI